MKVEFGNELTPTKVKDIPTVKWNAESDAYYTLCMTGNASKSFCCNMLSVGFRSNQVSEVQKITYFGLESMMREPELPLKKESSKFELQSDFLT